MKPRGPSTYRGEGLESERSKVPGDVLLKLPIHLFGGVAAQRA